MEEQVIGVEAESGLDNLATDVEKAQDAILSTLDESGGVTPSPRELQDNAGNGWSPRVMAIAFWSLVNRRVLTVDGNLHVHRPTAQDSPKVADSE